MTPLLLGIFLAALLFGALLWSAYSAYMSTGPAKWANLLTAILTIALMTTITYSWEWPGRLTGGTLTLTALTALFFDKKWSRLLPLTLATLGVFAAMGVPFS